MHGPAPVSLDPAGDGGAWRWAVAVLHVLAAASLTAWLLPSWPVPSAVAALGLVAAGVLAWRRVPAPARLAWDGRGWRLDDEAVSPTVALDLGGWMLLRLRDARGRRHWLPLSPARAGAAWPALRAALFDPPGPAA